MIIAVILQYIMGYLTNKENNMETKEKKDIRLAAVTEYKRKRLADQLPLNTPFGITVFTNTTCNLRCEFCIYTSEHMKRNVYKHDMTMETFTKFIDELNLFPQKIKALHFCPCGEPLLCKDIANMIKYAKKANIAEKIDILTNGVLLTPEISDSLVDAGIDWIRISLNGLSDEDFMQYCDRKVDFNKFVQNLKYLYEHKGNTKIYLKIMDYMVEDPVKNRFFHETFEPITDMLAVEFLQNHHDSKKKIQGNHGSMFNNEDIDKQICTLPFQNVYVMTNGDIMPCCYLKYVMTNEMKPFGNINKETLFDIWNSNKVKNFQYKMLCNGSKFMDYPCSVCNGPTTLTHPEDNLDNDSERLKGYYKV